MFLKKIKYTFFPGKIDVLIALQSNDGQSAKYRTRILEILNGCIDRFSLRNRFCVRDVSSILKFETSQEAENYCKEHGVSIIIWGRVTEDGLQSAGGDVNQLSPRFTFLCPDDDEHILGKMMILDIESKFAHRQFWEIVKTDSLRDVNVVSNNLFNKGCYALALSLKLRGRIYDSLDIFEKLRDDNYLSDQILTSAIKPHLLNCYTLLARDFYQRKNYTEGIGYTQKILALNPHSLDGLAMDAVYKYLQNDITGAYAAIKRMRLYHPTSNVSWLDEGFVSLMQGNYKQAYVCYQKVCTDKRPDFDLPEVVSFLDVEYHKTKNPVIKYAVGVLSCRFWDQNLGVKELALFLRFTKGISGMSKLRKHARDLHDKTKASVKRNT